MITVISMSPAIDKRLEFDQFLLHKTNRVQQMRAEAAGKGIAVAIAAKTMGLPVRCVGILPGMEPLFTERLRRHGVPFDFLPAPGAVRTNYKLFDQSTREITEVNEPCPLVPPELSKMAMEKIVDYAKTSAYLVLTGSLPEGLGVDWYAEIIQEARRRAPGCRCVLDADGERLRSGIRARPWMIKPNLEEIEQLTGERYPISGGDFSFERLLSAARMIQNQGVENVVISLGSKGAMIASGGAAFFAPSPSVNVVTTTSAGDSLVAGFLFGFINQNAAAEALRSAVAAGASRCWYGGDAMIDFNYMVDTCAKIQTTRID